jgi:hypothetical protein
MPSYVVTTPDGQRFKITADTDEQAQAAVNDLVKAPAPKQEMVGFGERGQREQEMPVDGRELAIAKGMARERPDFGAGDVFQQNYAFGLGDEAKGLGAGVGNLLAGGSFSQGYDVEKEIQKRLGQEYAEKNPGTNFAASLGGMLAGGLPTSPSAVTGLGSAMLQGGKSAGIQGAVQGAGDAEGLEGRALGAVAGGLLGGAIGVAAPLVTAGAKAIGQPIANTVRSAINPEKEAARRIAEAKARDLASNGMTDVEMYAAKQGGNPVINADRGENTRALARSAANQSPDARQAMDDVIRPRFQTQVERVDDTLRGQSTLGGNPEKFLDQAEEASRKANRKLYEKAYQEGSGGLWDDALEHLANSPTVAKALRRAIETASDRNTLEGFGAFNPRVLLDDAGNLQIGRGGSQGAYPDLRLWDLTKRELDSMGRQAKISGNKSDADLYTGFARRLRDHLDTKVGSYKAARESAAKQFGAENSYEAGIQFAKAKGMSARDAVKGLSKLSSEERKLFREGYIQAMRDELAGMKKNRDVTLTVLNDKASLEKARVALGKQGAQKLQAQLAVEEAMDAVRKAMGNSTTARQLTELGLASAAGSGAMAASGNMDPGSLTTGALAGAAFKYGKGKLNERLSAEIGRLLASGDQGKINAIIRAASGSPKYLEAVRALTKSLVSASSRELAGATASGP